MAVTCKHTAAGNDLDLLKKCTLTDENANAYTGLFRQTFGCVFRHLSPQNASKRKSHKSTKISLHSVLNLFGHNPCVLFSMFVDY